MSARLACGSTNNIAMKAMALAKNGWVTIRLGISVLARVGVCFAATVFWQNALAAGTAVGTIIQNTATIDFNRGGIAETATSNTITLTVAERLDVIVTPQPGQVIVSAAAVNQALLFTVTNLGNGTETMLLAINSILGGDDFDPLPVLPTSIFFDSDSSGDFNTGDLAYTAGVNDPVLLADESVDVFLLNDIPGVLVNGNVGRSELSANAVTGSGSPGDVFAGLGDGGADAVVGATGALETRFGEYVVQDVALSVVKAQSILDPNGGVEPIVGATITYTVTVEVLSAGTATTSYISDPIPTWSSFVPGSITLNGVSISDATDADTGEFDISVTPTVVVRLGDLVQADGVQTLVFQVTID